MKTGQIEEKYRHGQAGVGWASSSNGDNSCSSETPSLCRIKEMDLDLLYAGSEEAGLAHLSRGLCKGVVLGLQEEAAVAFLASMCTGNRGRLCHTQGSEANGGCVLDTVAFTSTNTLIQHFTHSTEACPLLPAFLQGFQQEAKWGLSACHSRPHPNLCYTSTFRQGLRRPLH